MFNTNDTLEVSDTLEATETRRLPGADRRQAVTPLDLRQPAFRVAFRGYDCDEVSSLLQEAAVEFEHALIENERLREELARSRASLHESREVEESLRDTLVSAHRMATEIRDSAKQEAEQIRQDAAQESTLLLARARTRLQEMQRELQGLVVRRHEALRNVETAISTLHDTVDFIRKLDTDPATPAHAAADAAVPGNPPARPDASQSAAPGDQPAPTGTDAPQPSA